MRGRPSRSVAVVAACFMFLVLVYPYFPTPTYTCKHKTGADQAAVTPPMPVACTIAADARVRFTAPPHEEVEQAGAALIDITCQRLC